MNTEKQLQIIMGRELELPRSTADRLEEVYEHIRRQQYRKDLHMNNKTISRSTRRSILTLAAAALMILCAGSVLAYTLTHQDFVNAMWRGGDTEQQTQAVEQYIHSSGQSVELAGYTFTVDDYMLDESGMGFVRYSLENPNGLPVMKDATNGGIYTGGDSEFWFEPDASGITVTGASYTLGSDRAGQANSHAWTDGTANTDTKIYFTDVFTFTDGVPQDKLYMTFSVYNADWEETSKTIDLAVNNIVPATEYSDASGGVRARLSVLGVQVYGPDFSGSYDLEQLVLASAEGDYVVIDSEQDIAQWRTATIGTDGSERVVFTQRAETEKVESITVNGYVLTAELAETVEYDPDASPGAEVITPDRPDRPDRTALKLASSPVENPFHYRRTDGIEVFVITNDTVNAASDEDIRSYVAFRHDCLYYEDFLESARDDYDEYYSSREYYAAAYPNTVPEGCMTAQQAIDKYLSVMEEYFPEEHDKVEYVVVYTYTGADWTLQSNADVLWEAQIDAQSRKLLSPWIVGYNGEFDRTTGEWIAW
ncbi:MAG: DUF4179 domain-containing protein [Ruminococcaceae bacterium]|nr:DUF4179 domain-containing protein [Oscillospiraceae bacterium]